jgi:hypothetical protein
MASPLDNRTDKDLERGLAEGEFGDKKAAFASEILSGAKWRRATN